MNPELERLLAALYERDHCEPEQRERWATVVRRLVADALQRMPGVTRGDLMAALQPRYDEYKRTRRKPPTLPPTA
jgi:predicted YcjX-like family ATPase